MLRNGPALKAAQRAPRGELQRYPGADHFTPYVPPLFDKVLEDQLAFLRKHLGEGDMTRPAEASVHQAPD